MNESTARAERFDLQSSTSSSFLWEVPQKPVAVRIPYSLIDRLEREAVDSFRSVTSKGSEIGGLLFGSATPGSPIVVSVADYELIECEYARGPLYRLSDEDLKRFQLAIQKRSGTGIAGFFRTHTRKGISLDADDLAVMDAHFRDSHHIALLIRPFATKASAGAIFIRENGKISGDASYLEFAFHAPAGEGKAPDPPEVKLAPAAPAAPPAPALAPAVKPAARAQIVPIAPRRETPAVEEKLDIPATPPTPPASVAAAPAPAPTQAPAVQTEKPAPKPEPKPEAKTETKPVAKVETKPSIKPDPKPEVKPEPKPEPKPEVKAAVREVERPAPAVPATALVVEEPAEKSSRSLKLILAAVSAMVLFVALFVYPGFFRSSSKKPNTPGGDTSALQLRVERSNGELLITWNRDSDAIRNATKAVLTINDGEQHENVEMDMAQLRNGSIVYPPQTADISFKLEVTGKDAGKTTSEIVRVLRTRPSPLDNATTPATSQQTPAPAPASATPANAQQTPAPPTAQAQEPAEPAQPAPKPVQATRAFNTQSLGARLRPALPSDMPDAPTVGGASAPVPGLNLGSVPIAAPNAPIPSAPSAASKGAPKAGGQIQQAILVSKKDPEYPKLARQTGAKGAVKLTATVGKDGHVKSVRVISGHPMLQAAAIEAVKQWLYKPTLLNGQPVETDTEIVLNFVGDR